MQRNLDNLSDSETVLSQPNQAIRTQSSHHEPSAQLFLPTIRAQLCAPKLGISKLPLTSGPPGTPRDRAAGASVTCPRASAPACILYARPRPRPRLPRVLAKLCDLLIMYSYDHYWAIPRNREGIWLLLLQVHVIGVSQ